MKLTLGKSNPIMNVIEYMENGGYEKLVVCTDQKSGLRAFIAIHNTVRGPALGGCRIWSHASETEAFTDVLRLAKAMTYKNAAAGLNLGGGKALIWADPTKDKSEYLLQAFGKAINDLGGIYITTEDVGSSPEDMCIISRETDHVVGLPTTMGGSGDPSKATGFGIYHGIKACCREVYGTDSLEGLRVAIQGFGKVAKYLSRHLLLENAQITVTDINKNSLNEARELGLTVINDPSLIYELDCDVFSPCALGATLNPNTIGRLKCKIIAGAANNQLLSEEDGELIHSRSILYAPDFILNAGGVINLSYEIGQTYVEKAALQRVKKIGDTISEIINLSHSDHISTNHAAIKYAEMNL